MRYGIVIPGGSAPETVAFGVLAEQCGWDAVFGWEAVYGLDPWVMLGAIAVQTEKVLLGTLLTPPSRRRPWKLASEVATLDHLSNGRALLTVGLGALETGFEAVGEITDRKIRAELLDESIELLHHFWTGKPFTYSGKHYTVDWSKPFMKLATIQQGGAPIWTVGLWPNERSLSRAFRVDGIDPIKRLKTGEWKALDTTDVDQLRRLADTHHTGTKPFDIVIEGTSIPNSSSDLERVDAFAAAGATWWIESPWDLRDDLPKFRERIMAGPPNSKSSEFQE